MSIQKVPIAALQKIRIHLQPALKLDLRSIADAPPPDSIAALSDVFAHSFDSVPTQGWRLSAIDPGAVFRRLPGLRLQPQYRLVGYLWQDDRGSRGQIWAVPIDRATTAELERAILRTEAAPPCPAAALPDLMLAVEGDRSPGSFLIAALLRRELQDWGASGAYCNWSDHRLIDRVPIALQQTVGSDRLPNLSPRLRLMPDRRVAVEFFTCRLTSPIQIFRHVDLFGAANYAASSLDREVLL